MSVPQLVELPDDEQEWDEDEDNDDDIDAEAEAIARRLGAELWADIRKAKAEGVSSVTLPHGSTSPTIQQGIASHSALSPKEGEALNTMRGILQFVEADTLARIVLSSSTVKPGEETILGVLEKMASTGTIPRNLALPLSLALVELAKSEALFGCLRLSHAPAVQLANGKRKRDESDEGRQQADARPYKRPFVGTDLQKHIEEAVHIITQTLGSATDKTLDASLVSSIRLQLHKVYLFAVTSSAGGGSNIHTLQEVGGLIQVIGVLSGIQIGQRTESLDEQEPRLYGTESAYPWSHPPASSIGTAIYPCVVSGCGKAFSRLYSLRGHQRLHMAHRPYRCSSCPASFARNHDLKRHMKLHSNKAWKCAGCSKVFSRRDAIKRHKDSSKTRLPKGQVCFEADVLEVEVDEEGDEAQREERRAKLWSGIAVNQISGTNTVANRDEVEEGEIPASVVSTIQATVLSLHGLLQALVGTALGTPVGQSGSLDGTGGQATLASVIARAQSQALPQNISEVVELRVLPDHATPSQSAGQAHMALPVPGETRAGGETPAPALSTLSMYGLSNEQTRLLEEAIASAALAARAQAEAEAALEEQEEANENYDEEDYYDSEGQHQADGTINELGDSSS